MLLALQVRAGMLALRRAAFLAAVVIAPAALALASALAYSRVMEARENAFAWSNLDVFTRSGRAPATEFPDGPLHAQCLEGLRVRVSEVGRLTVPGMFSSYGRGGDWRDPNLLVYGPLFVVLWVGWWRVVRRQPDAYVLTFPLYFAPPCLLAVQPGRALLRAAPAAAAAVLLACAGRAPGMAPAAGPGARGRPPGHRAGALAGAGPADGRAAGPPLGGQRTPQRAHPGCRWHGADRTRPGPGPLAIAIPAGPPHPYVDRSETVEPDVDWLVLPAGAQPCEGFRTEATAGPYQLLRRAGPIDPAPIRRWWHGSSPRSRAGSALFR